MEKDKEQLNEYLETALQAGIISLENGGETMRSIDTMNYMMRASGEKDCFADITSSTVFASMNGTTRISHTTRWDTNLYRLCEVNSVSRALCAGKINIRQAKMQLNACVKAKIYPTWMRLAASALTGGLLPVFMGTNPFNCIAALVNGLIMGLFSEIFDRIRIRYFIVNLIQSFLMVLSTNLLVLLTGGLIDSDIVLAASITPMLPGIALTNGVRDLLSGDYLSGGGRMTEAVVKALSIALGVGAGLSLDQFFHLPTAEHLTAASPYIWLIIQIFAAYVIAVGYTIRMVNPIRSIWMSALVGALGRLTYTLLISFEISSDITATFLAALLVALLGNIFARIYQTPTIVYLLSGIMCLVPGTSLYRSVDGFVSGNMDVFGLELTNTLMISGAIAVAIFLVDAGFLIYTQAKNKTLLIK